MNSNFILVRDAINANTDAIAQIDAVGAVARGGVASVPGLQVMATSVTAVDIDADAILLDNGAAVANVDLSVDITATGAGGLESGATEAASTWYYLWVVTGSSGTAGLLSTSSTSPTLPSGYEDGKRRVGAIRNNGSSNLVQLYQVGDWAQIEGATEGLISSGYGPGSAFTTLDLSAFVPSVSRRVNLSMVTGGSGSNGYWYHRPTGSNWATGSYLTHGHSSPTHSGLSAWVTTDGLQRVDIRETGGWVATMTVAGWQDPLGL